MLPQSRQEFKLYCLERLGQGAIDINITDSQAESRIDDALSYYSDYHFDGVEEMYYKHIVTAADITNEYITIPDNIIGVVKLYDVSNGLGSNLWSSSKYQVLANELNGLTNFSTASVFFTLYGIQEIQNNINTIPLYHFNRNLNKLYIDFDWSIELMVGQYILARAYKVMDPATTPDIWKDLFLLRYGTALMKRQWGSNLIKFEGMQLPGGVTFNGAKIYDDAVEEIIKLEDEMIWKYSLPPMGIIG